MLEPAAAAVPWRVLVRVRVRVHVRVVCAVQGFGGVDGGGGGVAAPSAPECSICLEEQGCGEECTRLPCGHEYHRQVWSTPCPCVKPPTPFSFRMLPKHPPLTRSPRHAQAVPRPMQALASHALRPPPHAGATACLLELPISGHALSLCNTAPPLHFTPSPKIATAQCVMPWLQRQLLCPNCRQHILSK
jgi:hypothetical protein